MKDVAILTINDYQNFGNRLQNFAVEQLIAQLGYNIETVQVYRNFAAIKSNTFNLKKAFDVSLGEYLDRINKRVDQHKYIDQLSKRESNFRQFTAKYLHNSLGILNKNMYMDDLSKYYRNLIVGSDQIWNPNYNDGTYTYFLPCQCRNKISLSASFGVSTLTSTYEERIAKLLKDFKAISVREESGKLITRRMGIDSIVIPDPTLLINKSEWDKLNEGASSVEIGENYILLYFLGYKMPEVESLIKKISKEYRYKIIDIMKLGTPFYSDIGPAEFINIISNAKLVFTDSFHASVFSILYHTPFVVCDRVVHSGKVSLRIVELLEKFNLEDRFFDKLDLNTIFQLPNYDTEEILAKDRESALTFLENNIENNNE